MPMRPYSGCECGPNRRRPGVSHACCGRALDHRKHPAAAPLLAMAVVVGLLCACSLKPAAPDRTPVTGPAGPPSLTDGLTPAQDFAAEALAYLLQVVVGRAGAVENRPGWRSAGVDMPLDYAKIAALMTTPGVPKSTLISMDASLLGLSKVLYYYNPRLNQFKGQYVFDSLYPSSELIAVRLLILRKLANGERVRLTPLLKHEALLRKGSPAPDPAVLGAINLSAEEFRLLKDVFASEPLFFTYYKHPHIVDALVRIGFYENDPSADGLRRRASYRPYARERLGAGSAGQTVTIAIVPSLTREFEFGGRYPAPYDFGFKPTATYQQVIETLKTGILEHTAAHLRANLLSADPIKQLDDTGWQRLWNTAYRPRIRFLVYDQRPFAVYPDSVERVVDALCPAAYRVIFVLGRDVYQAIDWSADGDGSHMFLDIAEIEHLQVDARIDEIALALTQQLEPFPFPVVDTTR